MDEKTHSIHITEGSIVISGITDAPAFDKDEVTLKVKRGNLIISGNNLKLLKLTIEEGIIELSGAVNSLKYAQKDNTGFFKRLVK